MYKVWTGEEPVSGISSYDEVWAFEVAEPPAPAPVIAEAAKIEAPNEVPGSVPAAYEETGPTCAQYGPAEVSRSMGLSQNLCAVLLVSMTC